MSGYVGDLPPIFHSGWSEETVGLYGSDLFPPHIRLADGRDVPLGDLVNKAAAPWTPKTWNAFEQKVRDRLLILAYSKWNKDLTEGGVNTEATLYLLEATHEFMYAALGHLVNMIEKCGASKELTDAVIFCSDLKAALGNKLNPHQQWALKSVLAKMGYYT